MYIIGVKLVLSKQSRLSRAGSFLVNLWKRESYKPDLKAAKKFVPRIRISHTPKKRQLCKIRGDSLEHGQGRTFEITFEIGNTLFYN